MRSVCIMLPYRPPLSRSKRDESNESNTRTRHRMSGYLFTLGQSNEKSPKRPGQIAAVFWKGTLGSAVLTTAQLGTLISDLVDGLDPA